jgi:hypothetical protein
VRWKLRCCCCTPCTPCTGVEAKPEGLCRTSMAAGLATAAAPPPPPASPIEAVRRRPTPTRPPASGVSPRLLPLMLPLPLPSSLPLCTEEERARGEPAKARPLLPRMAIGVTCDARSRSGTATRAGCPQPATSLLAEPWLLVSADGVVLLACSGDTVPISLPLPAECAEAASEGLLRPRPAPRLFARGIDGAAAPAVTGGRDWPAPRGGAGGGAPWSVARAAATAWCPCCVALRRRPDLPLPGDPEPPDPAECREPWGLWESRELSLVEGLIDAPPRCPRPVGGPLSGCGGGCCCLCVDGSSPAVCRKLRSVSADHSVATTAGGPCAAARRSAAAGATLCDACSPEASAAGPGAAAAAPATRLAAAAAVARGSTGGPAAVSDSLAAALSTEATGDRASSVPALSRWARASRGCALDCPAPLPAPPVLEPDTEAAGASALGSPPWLLTPLSAPLS